MLCLNLQYDYYERYSVSRIFLTCARTVGNIILLYESNNKASDGGLALPRETEMQGCHVVMPFVGP